MYQPTSPLRMEAPPVSILTTASRVPANTEWRSGLSHLPNGCNRAHNYPTCVVDGTDPEKCQAESVGRAEFDSWMMYVPDGCVDRPLYAEDWNMRSTQALDAYTAWALSLEMTDGAASGNPSLQSTAVDISGAGAVDTATAIGALLRARVEAGFGTGHFLHVPLWLFPSSDRDNLILRSGSLLSTAGGMALVSPGPGYTGASPAGVAAPPGEGYIYITGPVEYATGDIFVHPDEDEQHGRTNQAEVYAERPAIYRFDPCGVFAVLATGG